MVAMSNSFIDMSELLCDANVALGNAYILIGAKIALSV